MPTQDTDTDVLLDLTGFAPSDVERHRPVDRFPLRNYVPRGADDFFMYAYNRNTGSLTHLNEAVLSASWTEDLEEVVGSGNVSFSNVPDEKRQRVSHFVKKGTELRMFARNPVTGKAEEMDRYVVWDTERSSESTHDVVIYNYMKYLKESKITVLFNKGQRASGWGIREITRSICRQYGIRIGSLPRSLKKLDYFYQENQSILDILLRLWTMESRATGRKFVISIKRGRLYIRRKPKKPRSYVLELTNEGNEGGLLTQATKSESLDGIATIVRLWGVRKDYTTGTRDVRRAAVKSKWYASKKGVAAFGRIYFEAPVPGVTNQAEINKLAKSRLHALYQPKYDARVSIIGMPYLKAGMAVRVFDKAAGLNGLFWFKTIEHNIDGSGNYTASGQLTRYNYTKTLDTNASDLKPDNPNITSTNVNKHSNAIPRNVWLALRAASAEAGVPQSWANSKDLERLLQKESSFSFTADNPTSTAYGIFQFLDSTWASVGVPKSRCVPGARYNGKSSITVEGVGTVPYWQYWQCVAGLRYIKRRYGSPLKAITFHNHNGWY